MGWMKRRRKEARTGQRLTASREQSWFYICNGGELFVRVDRRLSMHGRWEGADCMERGVVSLEWG